MFILYGVGKVSLALVPDLYHRKHQPEVPIFLKLSNRSMIPSIRSNSSLDRSLEVLGQISLAIASWNAHRQMPHISELPAGTRNRVRISMDQHIMWCLLGRSDRVCSV